MSSSPSTWWPGSGRPSRWSTGTCSSPSCNSWPPPGRSSRSGWPTWPACPSSRPWPCCGGAPARIQSPCVATGDLVQIDLTPAGVEHVEPSSAVVSVVTPATDVSEVRRAVCAAQNFFCSAEAALQWQAEYPQALLLPVTDMFELYRRVVVQVWGVQLPSWRPSATQPAEAHRDESAGGARLPQDRSAGR